MVSYHVDIRRVINRKIALAIADGTMSVDGEIVYGIKNMKVGTFLSTDDM